MVEASEFGIASVQTVLFTPDVSAFTPQRVLADIIGPYGGRYNGPVTSIPLPDGAPPYLPRVLLQSVDNAWRLTAAVGRMDSTWISTTAVEPSHELGRLVGECSRVLVEYAERNTFPIGRMALIVARAVQIYNPAQLLIDSFCSEDAGRTRFNNSRAFEIHNHKVYAVPEVNYEINSWMRCRTALVLNEPGIAVEQDINTLEEELNTRVFDSDMLHDFYIRTQHEADVIMELYFPREVT